MNIVFFLKEWGLQLIPNKYVTINNDSNKRNWGAFLYKLSNITQINLTKASLKDNILSESFLY